MKAINTPLFSILRDSVLLKANPEAEYMIDKFIGSMLNTKFLLEKNTIENNYAGANGTFGKD